MNAQKYFAALKLSTEQAMKSPDITLPEIVGILEITKINVERSAYEHAKTVPAAPAAPTILPANGLRFPRKLPRG